MRSGGLLKLFRGFFAPHLQWFVGGTLAAAITSLAAVSQGLIVKFVGDALQVITGDQISPDSLIYRFGGIPTITTIYWLVGAIMLAVLVRSASLYTMTMLNNTGVQRALVDIQTTQFHRLTTGDYARLEGDASGGFVSRFVNDVNAIRDAGLRAANNLTRGVLTVIGAFVAMLMLDWQLTLLMLIAYPIAFAPIIGLGNRVRKRAKAAQKQVGDVTALLSEGFQSNRIVKAFGLEDYQQNRAEQGFLERSRLYLKVLADKAAVDPILEIAGGAAIAGVLGFSAWRIAAGDSTFGDFLGFIALIGIAAPELRALGTLNAVAQEGGAAADRVFEITDARVRVADAPDARALSAVRGDIRFEDVHFAYPDGTVALRGLEFTVAPGETVALVGPSGAGKSTVLNLILRLYDVDAGAVYVDGEDVRHLQAASVRRATALVAQDTALFDDTIEANIGLGRLQARAQDIRAAARAAHAEDFIAALPGGYQAPAGEMGRHLSGGQRQRVALARAILRDAPILLLDEATSALDAESEAKVHAALAEFARTKTCLIIAHRLSTVRAADRIIVISEGRVAETGTHSDLIAANGLYKKLVALQLT